MLSTIWNMGYGWWIFIGALFLYGSLMLPLAFPPSKDYKRENEIHKLIIVMGIIGMAGCWFRGYILGDVEQNKIMKETYRIDSLQNIEQIKVDSLKQLNFIDSILTNHGCKH